MPGNPLVRFDEGRGGRTFSVALSPIYRAITNAIHLRASPTNPARAQKPAPRGSYHLLHLQNRSPPLITRSRHARYPGCRPGFRPPNPPVPRRRHPTGNPRLPRPPRRPLLHCTRQWGKSTTGAIKALHHALLNAACLVLIASRTRRQAGELLEKIINFSKLLDIPHRRAPRHPDSLLLPNGSRIIALPGVPDSLRGFSAVSLLIIDLCEVFSNVEWPLESPVIIEVPFASTPH